MSSTSPSVFDTLRPDLAVDPELVKDGDCGIILRPDGDYRIFTTGVDAERLAGDPSQFTETEIAQMEMGRKLMAFSIALSNPAIMEMLLTLTADPEIIDPAALEHVRNPH